MPSGPYIGAPPPSFGGLQGAPPPSSPGGLGGLPRVNPVGPVMGGTFSANPQPSAPHRAFQPPPPTGPQPPNRQFNPPGSVPPNPMQGGDPSGGIRATGPSSGFDPNYLQNLATSDAGIFSRPQGGLAFNPLGNLESISGTSGGGNAPVAGIPQGMLTQALAANPTFQPVAQQTGLAPGAISTSLPNTQQNLAQMLQQVFGGQALANTQTQSPLTTGFTP